MSPHLSPAHQHMALRAQGKNKNPWKAQFFQATHSAIHASSAPAVHDCMPHVSERSSWRAVGAFSRRVSTPHCELRREGRSVLKPNSGAPTTSMCMRRLGDSVPCAALTEGVQASAAPGHTKLVGPPPPQPALRAACCGRSCLCRQGAPTLHDTCGPGFRPKNKAPKSRHDQVHP